MPSGFPRIPEPREWLLTKVCAGCGDPKPWARFSPREYWPDGSVLRVASHCHECCASLPSARRARASYEERNRDRRRVAKTRWKRRHRAAMRKQDHAGRLPAAPLRARLEAYVAEGGEMVTLAAMSGCSERVLRRVLKHAQEGVALNTVDRTLTCLGEHIDSLYPVDLERAA